MAAWLVITVALLIWNAVYCLRKVLIDFRGATPASGVWGVFALAGTISALALVAIGLLIAGSGL